MIRSKDKQVMNQYSKKNVKRELRALSLLMILGVVFFLCPAGLESLVLAEGGQHGLIVISPQIEEIGIAAIEAPQEEQVAPVLVLEEAEQSGTGLIPQEDAVSQTTVVSNSKTTITVTAEASGEVLEPVDTAVILPVGSILPAQTVVERKFSLYPMENWIALPLEVEGITMTSDLARYIESHVNKEVKVVSISSWNATAQSYTTYSELPFPHGDHPVSSCKAYNVFIETDETGEMAATFTGTVPELCAFDLKTTTGTDYNWITVPLGHNDIATAGQLKENIEFYSNPKTSVLTVSEWDPIERNYRTFPGLNFLVEKGRAYRAEVAQDAFWLPGEQPSNPVPPSNPEQPRFEITLNENEPVKVITLEESFKSYKINTAIPVNNFRIDISAFSSGSVIKTAVVPAAIEMNTEIDGRTVSVQIPKMTTISAPLFWDGTIRTPTLLSQPTIVPSAGMIFLTAVSVGFDQGHLTFDKAARILFPGQAGKLVGYVNNNGLAPIEQRCSEDSQTAGDALAEGGNCEIDVGCDLVVWSKHFTEFVVYEGVALPGAETNDDSGQRGVPGGINPYNYNPADDVFNQENDESQDNLLDNENINHNENYNDNVPVRNEEVSLEAEKSALTVLEDGPWQEPVSPGAAIAGNAEESEVLPDKEAAFQLYGRILGLMREIVQILYVQAAVI